MSDAAIVAGLRRGEAGALDRAFVREKDRLFTFLLRLGGRRDLAEDLLQETFLQLARHALRLAEETDLAAWLFTVARNAFRAHLRRHRAADRALARVAPEEPVPDGTERTVADRLAAERLLAALATLPGEQREVLLLAATSDLDGARAAAVLGIRAEAYRKRLERARAALARALGDALPSPRARR